MRILLPLVLCLAFFHQLLSDDKLTGSLIFPLEHWHNHGSCIVECPNGDMLVCWFHGSGERKSDDVEILGARLSKKTGTWSKPFPMADTPEFPDTNCCMIVDQEQKLWLLWPTIQANLWESALMKYKMSQDYMKPGPPKWNLMRVMHVKHSGDFADVTNAKMKAYAATVEYPDDKKQKWMQEIGKQAGDKLTRRLGWFTRAHPKILSDGRMLVGLYSDGFFVLPGWYHGRLGQDLEVQRTDSWWWQYPAQFRDATRRHFGDLHARQWASSKTRSGFGIQGSWRDLGNGLRPSNSQQSGFGTRAHADEG